MVNLLSDNPLVVLFLAIGIGAGFGAIRLWGVALGPAAALFAGLAFGAVDEKIANAPGLPLLQSLGLVLFAYTIGLASGPSFVAGVRNRGGRVLAVVVGLIAFLAGMVAVASAVLGFDAGERAGLFSGATTNTPALQAAIDALKGRTTSNPAVAYSLAFPSAVVAMIVVVAVMLARASRKPPAEQRPAPEDEPAVSWTVAIHRSNLPALGVLRTFDGAALSFGRVEHAGRVQLATADVELLPGDLVTVVGPQSVVREFATWAGERSDRHLSLDRRSLDFRRIVVSNRQLAGKRIADLDLTGRYGATVTRVRRGDVDIIATDDFCLQLGDRVRVVAPVDKLTAVATLLGDSDRSLGEVDALGFALGIAAGILLGLLAVPFPGVGTISLGPGGGPLVVGLALGVVSRIGPITFQLPQAANLTLRQLGILMFLACVGIRSGTTFKEAVTTGRGAELAVTGAVIALTFAIVILLVTRHLLQRDPVEAAGLLAGTETQPAALAFAVDRTGSDRVTSAYALAFPAAVIAKIVVILLLI